MAKSRRKRPEVMDAPPGLDVALTRAEVNWFSAQRQFLLDSLAGGRLPHGLMFTGQAGAGQSELALWLAGLLLCDAPALGRCGQCAGCKLFTAGTHPDYYGIGIEPDKTGVLVEQIRDLSADLALRSYRGRRKVALIDPADMMNVNAANSLLKTLEEPPEDTVVILVASRTYRLPATIVSRTSRVVVPVPSRETALAWLGQQPEQQPWERLLDLAHGAPFAAISLAEQGAGTLDQEMSEAVSGALEGGLDVLALAKHWSESLPAARLSWLRWWLMGLIRSASLGGPASDVVNNNRVPSLPGAGSEPIIRASYRLLDQIEDAIAQLSSSLNLQLLFEGLVIQFMELGRRVAKERLS